MRLDSSRNLHYPITVTDLLLKPGDHVGRSARLFAYTFTTTVTEGDEFGEEHNVVKAFPAFFESSIEGTLRSWSIQKGTVISGPHTSLVDIEEACTHAVQFGGLCVNCGKDMTEIDYNTNVPNTQRASTAIAHIHPALKISDEEATRIDHEAKQRLLSNRKLSLVVDLDLTIIHASVDPTIGDWQRDPNNPNHSAVKDVRSFELWDDAMGRDVSYYIKLRPYLQQFLSTVSQIYELYIYTMGTRAYADNIAKIVDPDKRLFGERILSRTETPGEDSKNLRKLFPVDNKMVVIIDDRADVWKWSNYLVRVQPFNFFVGIGDINASFLPKRDDILDNTRSEAGASKDQSTASAEVNAPPDSKDVAQAPTPPPSPDAPAAGDESALGQIVTMQEKTTDDTAEKKAAAEQDENLAAQLNERPLLQLQKSLEGESMPDEQHLLKDDDIELTRVQDILCGVHRGFFEQYDAECEQREAPDLAQGLHDIQRVPDVKDILEPLLHKPLRGARLVFSRIIPLNTDIYRTRWADMAIKLGATIQLDITNETTHLVTKAGDPTAKMRKAAARGIKIVRDDWLWDQSIQWWEKIDETPYSIYVDPGSAERSRADGMDDSPRDSGDEEERVNGHDLTINTGSNGLDNSDGELRSPAGDIHDAGWDDVFNDLDDELDGLSDSSTDEDGSNASGSQQSSQSLHTGDKRKRGDTDDEADDADELGALNGAGDSMLQKRKRKALARTSSLTNVQVADTDEEATEADSDDGFDEEGFLAAVLAQSDDDEGDEDE